MKQLTHEWIEKSENDHETAIDLLGGRRPKFDVVCFLSQQSAEEYLKAFPQERDVRFSRTHDLDALLALTGAQLPGLAARQPDLVWLTTSAVDIRYPGAEAGSGDATRAVDIATTVRAAGLVALGLGT